MARSRRLEFTLTTVLVLVVALCGGGYLYHLQLNRELLRAAASGDAKAVERCLIQGAAINTQTKNAETPLLLASRRGSLPTVRLLLERGAKVDARDQMNATALWWVAARDGDMPGRANLAEALLSHGADPNHQERSKMGITPLGWSAAKGDAAMVAVLLRYGADLHSNLQQQESYAESARRAAYTRAATVSQFSSMAATAGASQRYGLLIVAGRERVKQREAEKAVRLLTQAAER